MTDLLHNFLNLGGGGTRQVTVDPSRVTKEEFEAATTFANILWGTDGLAECLGPSWYLVHDPRFSALERLWVKTKPGMAGGMVTRGTSTVLALDTRSTITLTEDPELYSEMLAEGRHFMAVCQSRGITPQDLQDMPETIQELIAQECPNYQRRNGTWNEAAEQLAAMLKAGLVGLVADYAELAYSRDWVRLDTGEVVHKDEELWDEASGMMIPTAAVEVDTLHKALVMRAMIRTTALRALKQFPGVDWAEFESTKLTDEESDTLCQLLFKTEYDKLYTVLPQIMNLVRRAQSVPYEDRERTSLSTLSQRAKAFIADMKSGKIEPILTPIEENPDAPMDPTKFLMQVQQNTYCASTFQAIQNLGERGDEEADTLCGELVASGGTAAAWAKVDNYLLQQNAHPKQDVFEGRCTLPPGQMDTYRQALAQAEIIIEEAEADQVRHLTEAEVELGLEVLRYTMYTLDGMPQAVASQGRQLRG